MKTKIIFKRYSIWVKGPTGFYLLAIFSLVIVFLGIDWIIQPIWLLDDLKSFWVNLHASIVEVFLLGLFITRFNKLNQDKREMEENIKRWKEEIEDYLGWDEKEATYRLVGLIRRLSRNKVDRLVLYNAYLKEAYLWDAHLEGANLWGANLQSADLALAHLEGAVLTAAHLEGANLYYAHLHGAKLNSARMTGSNLFKANMVNADLRDAQLGGARLEETCLTGVYVNRLDWFIQLKEWNCSGVEKIDAMYSVAQELEKGERVYRIRERLKPDGGNTIESRL